MVAEAAEQSEPTMEEILASIRKIIATEGAAAPAEDEVLELTEEIVEEAPAEPVEEPVVVAAEIVPEPIQEEAVVEAPPIVMDAPLELVEEGLTLEESPEHDVETETDVLVSSDVTAVASTSFLHLEEQLAQHRAPLATHTEIGNGHQTLESLVTDIMRPLLKEWLDNNLPSTVERLVKSEIERIARRHGD
jgi:cell pole-organizing protein PopZ